MTQIPKVFCWSKMGAEAGQSLEEIVRRKELERGCGEGTFSWGIGNSLGNAPTVGQSALDHKKLPVLFTLMKCLPKEIDVNPTATALWLDYYDENKTIRPLPSHMIVTSRSASSAGVEKKRHYALMCKSDERLQIDNHSKMLFSNRISNLVSSNPVGSSQVTSIVRYNNRIEKDDKKGYKICFSAQLAHQTYVRLATPIIIKGDIRITFDFLCESTTSEQWAIRSGKLKQLSRKIQPLHNTCNQLELSM